MINRQTNVPFRIYASVIMLTCLLAHWTNGAFAASEKPNVIIIVADDLGWNDVSWHKGGGNKIKTPYLESLADSGTKLENYYIY